MTSAQTENLLQQMQAAEEAYRPSKEVADSLREKTLVMIVGPVAIGKSFIINQVTSTDPDFKQVSVFTTRDARPGENTEQVRVMPHEDTSLNQILNEIKKGNLVQYTIHPTTRRIYGTVPDDFSAKYNLLPTLSGAVESRKHLPFAHVFTIFLTARPEIWLMWLNSRYPEKDAERARRIEEAIISLRWALDDSRASTISWVENNVQTPERTIEDIINIVKYKQQGDSAARKYATQMLELAIKERYETYERKGLHTTVPS